MAKQWIAAGIFLALAGTNGAQAQDYPDTNGDRHRAFRRRRAGRHHGPYRRRYFLPPPRPEVRGGECRRRRRHHRRDSAPPAPRPDGYTILSGHLGTNALAPAFYPNLAYDPQKDFEPIGLIAEYPELLVVRKDFPANNLKEFVAYAKANPDKLNVGHAGLGSVSYIGCLLLNAAIGIKPTMIPFTGTAPVLNAMLSARSTMNAIPCSGTLSQVQAGNVKALAVAAKKRSPLLPDVPTSYEQGLPEFDMRRSTRYSCRQARRRPVVDKLVDALNKGLDEDAVQKRLADLGAESVEQDRRGPKALADLVKSESARLMPILKAAAEKEK